MTMTLDEALVAALNDEYHARTTDRAVIDAFGDVRPFVNIVESEERHIEALSRLFDRYDVSIPLDRWFGKVAAPESVEAACEKGVEAERANAALYKELLAAAEDYPDVEETFHRLLAASQNNHLPAFERGMNRERRSELGGEGRGRGHRRRHRGGRGQSTDGRSRSD